MMSKKTTIQSLPVRMGCSTKKGGDAHGGKQTLGSISALTMNAVYLEGMSMPEQITAAPIRYHQVREKSQEAANF
jgi:hypothetical protein